MWENDVELFFSLSSSLVYSFLFSSTNAMKQGGRGARAIRPNEYFIEHDSY